MTQLTSGFINTGTNTPTGTRMQVATDNPYVSKYDFINSFEASGLGITENSPEYTSGQLDTKILQASAFINRYCRRWFDTQTVDEQKTNFRVRPLNPQLVTVVLRNSPYSKINSIYIQVLKWFIEVDVSVTGYLQDFYQDGYYKIVPLLSSAGTGAGSPIPSQVINNLPLGVLWTNYTFGYGTPLTDEPLTQINKTNQYQAPIGNRIWAPDQPTTVKVAEATVTTGFTVDYPNGIITFSSPQTGNVTASFTTNDSTPADIKEAAILVTASLISQAQANPTGAGSQSIQTYSASWSSGDTKIEERFKRLLEPYVDKKPIIL